jgi:hypothetical protein
MLSIFVTVFLLGLNSNILFTFGYEFYVNQTKIVFCFEVEGFENTKWMTDIGPVRYLFLSKKSKRQIYHLHNKCKIKKCV